MYYVVFNLTTTLITKLLHIVNSKFLFTQNKYFNIINYNLILVINFLIFGFKF